MTYLEAISDGLREEMRRDETVFCLGEDIGAFGGAFKVTDGFIEEFGADRVRRHAAGRERDHRRRRRRRDRGAAAGLRDAVRRLHRLRVRPARQRRGEDALPPGPRRADGGPAALRRRLLRRPVPLAEPGGLVPAGAGAEGGGAGDRRRTPRACWPARSAIPTRSASSSTRASTGTCAGEVPAGEHAVPIGEARVAREGERDDRDRLRLRGRAWREQAAEELGEAIEVIDLRTLVPARHRGDPGAARARRARCWSPTRRRARAASAPRSRADRRRARFEHLDAPVRRLTAPDVPIPFSPPLEQAVLPQLDDMKEACRELLAY